MQSEKASLIREWVAKLAINAGQALDSKTQAVYESIWSDGLADLPLNVLRAAFQKTLRECKFWPVKVADIRQHVDRAKETALGEAADLEWQRVLDLRRVYWNPDMPGGFSRGMPKLTERVQNACRAAGVFRNVETTEQLHIWGKKRFIESYLAWESLEQSQYLLADGELKNMLAEIAETKALPPPATVPFEELHKRGLEYAGQVKAKALLRSFKDTRLPEEELQQILAELAEYGARHARALEQRKKDSHGPVNAVPQPINTQS